MYFHGDGWILANKDTHDRLVREIANGAKVAVVFVDYTPSPEAKYPTAIEQAYTATKHVAEHGNTLNLDAARLAVVGDSVGGNMAAVVTLLAKRRGGPKIDYQVLFYPVTDADLATPLYQELADGPGLPNRPWSGSGMPMRRMSMSERSQPSLPYRLRSTNSGVCRPANSLSCNAGQAEIVKHSQRAQHGHGASSARVWPPCRSADQPARARRATAPCACCAVPVACGVGFSSAQKCSEPDPRAARSAFESFSKPSLIQVDRCRP